MWAENGQNGGALFFFELPFHRQDEAEWMPAFVTTSGHPVS